MEKDLYNCTVIFVLHSVKYLYPCVISDEPVLSVISQKMIDGGNQLKLRPVTTTKNQN